jgi:AcrR family transcriptional regulator
LRRRQIADAAIELLGSKGARGLSHPRVDQHAGLPVGTASYYFRTRKALLQATAERVSDLDVADLSMMTELAGTQTTEYLGTKGLASLVMLSSTEPWLTRTRARYELLLAAHHDSDLAATMVQFGVRFYSLAREVVSHWHPGDRPVEAAVIDEQAVVVLTYVNGVMMSFIQGYPVVADADHLDNRIQDILRGINSHGH